MYVCMSICTDMITLTLVLPALLRMYVCIPMNVCICQCSIGISTTCTVMCIYIWMYVVYSTAIAQKGMFVCICTLCMYDYDSMTALRALSHEADATSAPVPTVKSSKDSRFFSAGDSALECIMSFTISFSLTISRCLDITLCASSSRSPWSSTECSGNGAALWSCNASCVCD